MKILALEFSSPLRSVAVLASSAPGGTAAAEVAETGGRATQALGMIEEALRQAQLEREQIECLAIGLGPGSYTGIRAAISLAQGWQLAGQVKLAGLSSADAIAAQARQDGLRGETTVVIDAQRNELYLADYGLTDFDWRELRPLRLATRAELEASVPARPAIGPEITRWFPDARVVFPRAATLALLAQTETRFVPAEQLEPIYLRPTQFVKAPPPRIVP